MPDLTTGARSKRSVFIIVLSVTLGLGGAWFSQHYIQSEISQHKAALQQTESMVSVVVPNRALKRGETIQAQDLSVRQMPAKYVDSNAVTDMDYQSALGQRLDYDVDKGRPLLWAYLQGEASPTFSGKVPDGLRALTVRVDEINAISGFLQPQDRVDLLLTHGYGEAQQIVPLIDQLEVIATGVQTLVDNTDDQGMRNFSTITVQVTPIEAQRITLAQKVGHITAVLRNPDDQSPVNSQAISVAELIGTETESVVVQPLPAKNVLSEPVSPAIEFIIGGS